MPRFLRTGINSQAKQSIFRHTFIVAFSARLRCLFLGNYPAESRKGILGGSDRIAAVKGIVEAAGGTVNMVSFARGPFDFVVEMNLPTHEIMMGAMVTVRASGSITGAIYIELIDGDPFWEATRSIAGAFKLANA
tara:strand:+ start:257 stop:661 length:405 start_codon:yes stop_codon:yes gene_type:complete